MRGEREVKQRILCSCLTVSYLPSLLPEPGGKLCLLEVTLSKLEPREFLTLRLVHIQAPEISENYHLNVSTVYASREFNLRQNFSLVILNLCALPECEVTVCPTTPHSLRSPRKVNDFQVIFYYFVL